MIITFSYFFAPGLRKQSSIRWKIDVNVPMFGMITGIARVLHNMAPLLGTFNDLVPRYSQVSNYQFTNLALGYIEGYSWGGPVWDEENLLKLHDYGINIAWAQLLLMWLLHCQVPHQSPGTSDLLHLFALFPAGWGTRLDVLDRISIRNRNDGKIWELASFGPPWSTCLKYFEVVVVRRNMRNHKWWQICFLPCDLSIHSRNGQLVVDHDSQGNNLWIDIMWHVSSKEDERWSTGALRRKNSLEDPCSILIRESCNSSW